MHTQVRNGTIGISMGVQMRIFDNVKFRHKVIALPKNYSKGKKLQISHSKPKLNLNLSIVTFYS
jgi:hypothetical protein